MDCREAPIFSESFIPHSLNIGLDINFAMWVGELIPDINHKIALVCSEVREEEALIRLSRVGFDNSIGYLKGGYKTWLESKGKTEFINRISTEKFEKISQNQDSIIIDVRKKSEFESEHIISAINLPLNQLETRLAEIPHGKNIILHCAGGYRSMIAASILKQRGWQDFADVSGGFEELATTSLPKTEYVCPTTLL